MAIYKGAVQIGAVIFENFGIPESVKFGGPERLVIHKQPGGARQIDVMGDDQAPIEWSGLLLQEDAHDKAVELHNMKVAGNPVKAIWSSNDQGGGKQYPNFEQTVLIEDVTFTFKADHMIEYHIKCVPILSAANAGAAAGPNLGGVAGFGPAGGLT